MLPFFNVWEFTILLFAPVVTSLVLVLAVLRRGSVGKKAIFHLIAMPVLFFLSVLWFRSVREPFYGYFYYASFVTFLYLYLKVASAIRWYRSKASVKSNV
jgi:hypothetical protein